MIKTIGMLREELSEYRNPDAKVKRLVDSGEYIALGKGLYETDKTVPGYYLAGAIYGPSYLSFEFALSLYGLIPEAVYSFTSATFEKKRKKQYVTSLGVFSYRDIPSSVYPYEINLIIENGYAYQLAAPEKALCDMLYKAPLLKNLKELKDYLFEDLRIDIMGFNELDTGKIKFLCGLYKTKNHKLMQSLLRG